MSETVEFQAEDGISLSGQLFQGTGGKPLVLVSSATAVPQGFYAAFARHLVDHGARAVLTYDYRGVSASRLTGKSRKPIRFKDWAMLDFPAALRQLQSVEPGHETVSIGQSFGGQALGISGQSAAFTRYGMVAAMSGALRLLNDRWAWPRMNLVGVPVSYFTKNMPKWVGGEPIPGTVFRDWARWCRMENYFFDDPHLNARELVAAVRTPIFAIGLDDDPWGTRAAVQHFLDYHVNAPIGQRWYSRKMAGNQPIGHLGYFRSRFAETLWPEMTGWLLDGKMPDQAEGSTKG
ncbi:MULTISPECIES: esterase [Brucella]|uniref:Esterase n=9 Tax=Brucella TaxID=234 RepID=A0AAI8E6D7_BRUSS|nr:MULTISPECIES: esterase [Brucella]EXU84338.1 esterase [Brucella melitensis 548]AAN29237.1 conserved hypothetical protein [Brucella suis 1330]ABQ61951.1 conserved hypothetical protein [Brucella ovis ATCC 25840]ABY37407.1 Hypothetical protein BSUIS_A0313 [Brucella suis ATCC 23445]ACO00114.1 Hypothetical protein, conserved [Brucella melitensis ATCC 23457]